MLTGRLGWKTPHGASYAETGTSMNGHGADTPMEVFSAGISDLNQHVKSAGGSAAGLILIKAQQRLC